MIVLDFLVYYFTYWFNNHKDKLSWSTPVQTSCYVVGLIVMALLFSINEFFEFGRVESLRFHFSKLLYSVLAVLVMKLFDYIYTTKNRYQIIATEIPAKFNISDDTGAIICIGIAFLTIMSPFIVSTIVIPFGGHTLRNR